MPSFIIFILGMIVGVIVAIISFTFEEDYRDYDDTIDLP